MGTRLIGRKSIVIDLITGTPVPISSSTIQTPDFEVFFPTANTGATTYIGDSSVDNTWIPRSKGVSYGYCSGTGSMGGTIGEIAFDLKKFYILGTTGDKARIEYMYYDHT